MGKRILMLVLTVVAFAGLSLAADQTFSGVVSDNHCAAKHSTASDAAAACVEKCVAGGAKYVLVSEGKVYQLDAQDKFAKMGGTAVTVTGTAEGDAIHVTSVEAAK